jgi:hypothetical protein
LKNSVGVIFRHTDTIGRELQYGLGLYDVKRASQVNEAKLNDKLYYLYVGLHVSE